MSKILSNADKPANPVKPEVIQGNQQVYTGLTKREHFAAMAMQGLCADSIPGGHHLPRNLSVEAVQHADALLEALEANK